MNMRTTLAAVVTAAALVGGAAQASTISISTFSITEWTNKVGMMDRAIIQDFETLGPTTQTMLGLGAGGELMGPLNTNVGTFSALGGQGGGTTCAAGGGDCTELSLFGPAQDGLNGQGNLVPVAGSWSLNSDDTLGMSWTVQLAGGLMFNQVIFGIRDAADQRAVVQIGSETAVAQISNAGNNNRQLVVVNFHTPQDLAIIRIENINGVLNDAFSIDGAAVSAVPLPAAAWMLLAGLGGLFGMRRLRKAA